MREREKSGLAGLRRFANRKREEKKNGRGKKLVAQTLVIMYVFLGATPAL